jgi:hypothetical protein
MRYYPAFGVCSGWVRVIALYRPRRPQAIMNIGDLATKFAMTPNWTPDYV